MEILELRILPPVAIGRLGSSDTPVSAYDLVVSDDKPVGFRQIQPQETYAIDPGTHSLQPSTPTEIIFKDPDGKIRPVAPFLELFAVTSDKPDELQPVTANLLAAVNKQVGDVKWGVTVGNLKIFRRTADINDQIIADVQNISDTIVHTLDGRCNNFLPGKVLPLGTVQAINPTHNYPGLRLRFTPAGGKVYGSDRQRIPSFNAAPVNDPIINDDALVLYNKATGKWRDYKETASFNATYTMPAQIFAGYDNDTTGDHYSWGYLDDECDGTVKATLEVGGKTFTATAHIVAGPPAFAPDILPIRAVSDELEQILKGTERDDEVSIEEAEEIVRRAFESITLMNTAVMNGNPINGRENVASTMVRQDTNDLGRLYEPIMATSIVDNLALRTLHERVFNGLSTGAAAWFAAALRRPDKIGDLSDTERRKMPGMMRGADGRALTLTYRMINTVVQAAAGAMFNNNMPPYPGLGNPLEKSNLVAQLHYRGNGNPYSVLARAAISNCFPGLEYDFRNLWRRVFNEIVLSENDNYVLSMGAPGPDFFSGKRLVAIHGYPTMVAGEGPVFPGGANVPLSTADNPGGAVFMEWSNLIAHVIKNAKDDGTIDVQFTADKAPLPVLVTAEDLKDTTKYPSCNLTVNPYFLGKNTSAAIPEDLVKPGELTHGLCAPWQNDYRECACYYWAASRPDYVNVEAGENGLSKGDMWLSKRRTGQYVPDNRTDSRLVSYDDLFRDWEGELQFIINGKDATSSEAAPVSQAGKNPDVLIVGKSISQKTSSTSNDN